MTRPAATGLGDPHDFATALAEGTARLSAAGIEGPRRDARLLLASASGLPPGSLVAWPERRLEEPARALYRSYLERRAAREPVARILGTREFWSLPFRLSSATLDPRPDSETLVAALLARLPERHAPLRLLDLGTGSGCLLLALLSELPAAWGLGVDFEPEAAAAAAANAAALGLAERAAFLAGDWATALEGRFDIVVANPPYIAHDALTGLEPEVRLHDPRGALDGGPDGLDGYRALAPQLPRLLQPGGWAAVEIGADQADAASRLMSLEGPGSPERLYDLGGRPRGLLLHAPAHALGAGSPL